MIRASVQVQFLVPTVQTEGQSISPSVDTQILEVDENVLVTYEVPVSEVGYFQLMTEIEEDYIGKHPVNFDDLLSPDVLEYIFSKSLADEITSATDTTVAFVKKAASDESSVSETYYSVITKDIQDSLGATDDFLGEANIDDDQVALVVKPRYENAKTADAETRQFDKSVVDPVEANTEDDLTTDLTRPIEESYSSTDDYASHLTRPVEDHTATSDEQTSAVDKNRNDVAETSEHQIFDFTAERVDEPVTSEDRTVEIIKVFFDHIGVTDDFFGDANPDDDQTMDFDKNVNVTDSDAGVTDSQIAAVDKPSIDVAGLVERAVYEFSKLTDDQTVGLDEAVLSFLAARADFSVFDDYITSAFTKDVQEDLGATDDFLGDANVDDDQVAIVVKPLGDRPKTSETTEFTTTKPLTDSGAVDDDAPYELTKPREDFAAASEEQLVELDKAAEDNASTAEEVTQAVVKPLEDPSLISEETTLGLQTPREDSASTEETVTSAFTKDVNDDLGATDDFLGATNVDDDQTSHVQLAKQDNGKTSEQTTFENAKPLQDDGAFGEDVTSDVAKPLEDNTEVQDPATVDLSKALLDRVGLTDHLVLSLSKFREDGLLSPDDPFITFVPYEGIPSQEDNGALGEIRTTNNWKSLADYGTCAETVYALTYKRLSDTCGLATEAHTLTLRRESTEAVSLQNSGYVVMTDYCDSSYFAEPFVGVGREIT